MAITICRAVIIYFFVILAVRVTGRRQVGELSSHEFVITILISAVATIPLEDNELPLSNSLIPILIFVSLEIIESAISMKSNKFRDLMQGRPILIIKDGILQQKEMIKLRLTLDDVLDSLRQKDIFDISEIKDAVVETDGTISVSKKSDNKEIPTPIVEDGGIVTQYFGGEEIKKSVAEALVASSGYALEDIMLMTVDKNGKVNIIKKEKNK